MPGFGLELGEEDRFEHEVAKLFAERAMIVRVDRLDHFVGFLEHERLQRVDRLLAIPGAAARPPESRDDVEEAGERFGRGRLSHLVIE